MHLGAACQCLKYKLSTPARAKSSVYCLSLIIIFKGSLLMPFLLQIPPPSRSPTAISQPFQTKEVPPKETLSLPNKLVHALKVKAKGLSSTTRLSSALKQRLPSSPAEDSDSVVGTGTSMGKQYGSQWGWALKNIWCCHPWRALL